MATLNPLLLLILLSLIPSFTRASPDCVDAGLLSSSLTDFCFECLFPLRIGTIPTQPGPMPPNVTEEVLCTCAGDQVGITVGSWHPVRLIEVVTTPGCSPLMGGVSILSGMEDFKGTVGAGDPLGHGTAFFHVHSFPFPFTALVDPFADTPCRTLNDSAPPYFTETDPGWNLTALSWIDSPESLFTLNPATLAACSADAYAATAGEPIDVLAWCAGSWGLLFPLTGSMRSSVGTDPSLTSLAAIRHQGLLHRRGLGLQTTGDEALQGGIPSPFLQKSQYRLSRIYPTPEIGNHAVGAAASVWGADPPNLVPGGPTIYILWRWEDCCFPII